ncbi:MAG: hypothetical protein EHM12_13610 [Dehalococcoidia bacterium]|nr:MAG: hypothetical protein EHM12_13610 [Dehalococcoidia bacterium]
MNKKIWSLVLLAIMVILLLGFTACDKLSFSNLRANYYLRQANGLYSDEKFKKAADTYEKALENNSELKVIYFYLGTSYSALFKRGKETDINKMYGEKALEYLLKAKEYEPENIKILHALGDMYEKIGNVDESEKYYRLILDKQKDNPKAYYVVAGFFSNNGKHNEAEEMYKKRIDLDPENAEGYHYLAGFYQGRTLWYQAADNHELRIACMLDKNIVKTGREIQAEKAKLEKIKKKKDYIANMNRNKAIPAQQKSELVGQAQKELAEIGSEEQINNTIKSKQGELDLAWKRAYEKAKTLPPDEKKKVSIALYDLGLVRWNHSYQTPSEMMSPKERAEIIKKGMDVLNQAFALDENNWESLSIIALLYLQEVKVNPEREAEYKARWQKTYDQAIAIRDRNLKREKMKKQLEEIGQE